MRVGERYHLVVYMEWFLVWKTHQNLSSFPSPASLQEQFPGNSLKAFIKLFYDCYEDIATNKQKVYVVQRLVSINY